MRDSVGWVPPVAGGPPAPYPPAPSTLSDAVLAPSDLGPPEPRSPRGEPSVGEMRDLSSTDELEDPEGDAAADAGIAAPAATQRAAESPFESTQLIEEPDADATDDAAENPFAFTQVHVEVGDD
ncbi:MAG TPA: hypothetical protein ENK57_17145 [Polyangiaceae bacterium]|nr:hypothetical protein [Polyangiaceae bacterium]